VKNKGVALVADGLSNRQVANELSLSEHTVKKYLFRIFDKLGISSRVELVLCAISNGGIRQAEWVAGGNSVSTKRVQASSAGNLGPITLLVFDKAVLCAL
jgi:Bacterial regulatory proteins, luxR family